MITIEDVKNYLEEMGFPTAFAAQIPVYGYWSEYTYEEMVEIVDSELLRQKHIECHFPYLN